MNEKVKYLNFEFELLKVSSCFISDIDVIVK